MRGPGRAAAFLLALLIAPAGGALAQEGFRSTDLDRPLRVEDAQPIERHEWELASGIRVGTGAGDRALAGVELSTGAFANGQVGIELHGGREDGEGGLEEVAGHVLIGLRRETWSAPAVAARVDVQAPGAGDLGREGWGVGVTGIATRSFDRLRLHANAGLALADHADGGGFVRAGLAFDYPLALFSRVILGDVAVEVPTGEGDARVWTTLGSRWQVGNRTVLDVGIGGRADRWADGEGDVELVVGLTRAFGVPALVSVPPYPDPRID